MTEETTIYERLARVNETLTRLRERIEAEGLAPPERREEPVHSVEAAGTADGDALAALAEYRDRPRVRSDAAEYQRRIVAAFVGGHSAEEISRACGRSAERVRQIIRRAA